MIQKLGKEVITIIYLFCGISLLVFIIDIFYLIQYSNNKSYVLDDSLSFVYFMYKMLYWAFLLGTIWFVHKSQLYNFERGVKDLNYSPTWVGIWWFIPFLNLWMPFKVVKETYLSSFQVKKTKLDIHGYNNLWSWWGSWVLAKIIPVINNSITRIQYSLDTSASLENALAADILATFFIISAALSFITIIKSISANEIITIKE